MTTAPDARAGDGDLFAALFAVESPEVDEEVQRRPHARLVAAATEAGILDVSYAAVAAVAGHPKAVRAVGTVCATNPLPVVVPCHRVVRSDGAVSQYAGGTDAKRALLALEAAA